MTKRKFMDDHELIYLVLQGDDAALEELIAKYKGMLFRTLETYRGSLKEEYDVSELYQISLISLYHAVLTYNGAIKCSFVTYLRIIVHRDILAYIRKLNRDHSKANLYSISLDQTIRDNEGIYLIDTIENTRSSYNPQDCFNLKELEILIKEQLNSFSEKEQEVFILWFKGYRYDEIAAISGYDVKKISYLLTKIKKKLKGSIDEAYTL